eukprot:snap_masked-scaffold_45-processed-gene-1.72-mRNA-1 protein AED:1.00 eAED:1.00 QI:0/-1/0/0/-1/1/1/0/352
MNPVSTLRFNFNDSLSTSVSSANSAQNKTLSQPPPGLGLGRRRSKSQGQLFPGPKAKVNSLFDLDFSSLTLDDSKSGEIDTIQPQRARDYANTIHDLNSDPFFLNQISRDRSESDFGRYNLSEQQGYEDSQLPKKSPLNTNPSFSPLSRFNSTNINGYYPEISQYGITGGLGEKTGLDYYALNQQNDMYLKQSLDREYSNYPTDQQFAMRNMYQQQQQQQNGHSYPHFVSQKSHNSPSSSPTQNHYKKRDTGKDWICQVCGNKNYSWRHVCNMRKCRAPKPGGFGVNTPPGSWACLSCGNLNYAERVVCNMRKCRAPKPTNIPPSENMGNGLKTGVNGMSPKDMFYKENLRK